MSVNQVKIDAKQHAVTAVTVYQTNRAVIQRWLPVELIKGQNELAVVKLPRLLQADSIRVEAECKSASQRLTVCDVIVVPPSYSQNVPNETGSEREALNDSRERLAARLEMLQKQELVLDQYSDDLTPAGEGRLWKPADLEAFLDLYSARRPSIYEQRTAAEKELKHIDKKLAELEDHANTLRAEMQLTGITVVMLAREDGPSTLILSYVVTQASWFSLYDVRAELYPASEASTPSVNLLYHANIKQTTGEDWKGVSLTLSTASPTLGTPVPTFDPWRISPVQPTNRRWRAIPAARKRKRGVSDPEEAEVYHRTMGSALFDEGPAITVNHSAIGTVYSVEGLSTITSDESWHRVSIADLELSAEFQWVTLPRKSPSAFLQCRIENISDFDFISGPGNVFMDGNFVAKSHIPDVSPQETFLCSLGVDPSIRITYHPQKKHASTAGGRIISEKTKVTTFRQRITIKHTRPTTPIGSLIVQDQVPLSEDARIIVKVLQPPEKALGPVDGPSGNSDVARTLTAKVDKNIVARWAQKSDENGGSGGSRGDGVIEWICSELSEPVDLELVYEISTPLRMRLAGI